MRSFTIIINEDQRALIERALFELYARDKLPFAVNMPGEFLPSMFRQLKDVPEVETGGKMVHRFCL